jgi:hypothetical protein
MKAYSAHDINLRVRDYERRVWQLRAASWSENAESLGHSWVRPVLFVAGLGAYVVTGWLLLTNLFSGTEPAPVPQQSIGSLGARATIRVKVIDGPTLSCATSAGRAAGDTLIVSAGALPELFRKLDCWHPGDT